MNRRSREKVHVVNDGHQTSICGTLLLIYGALLVYIRVATLHVEHRHSYARFVVPSKTTLILPQVHHNGSYRNSVSSE